MIASEEPNLANPAHYTTPHASTQEPDHDQILRDYDSAIRDHERRMHRHRRHLRRHRDDGDSQRSRSPRPSKRFRFKEDAKTMEGSRRSHRDRDGSDSTREGPESQRTRMRSSEKARHAPEENAGVEAYAAHPLPRPKPSAFLDPDFSPSASPPPSARPSQATDTTFEGPDAAFRSSLFDALADDEGAAYWEGVYGEPIHNYTRPTVRTEDGKLEHMTDEQYVEYVKRKMWEKKNPDLVAEREARAKREVEEDERRRRRKHGGEGDGSDSEYEWIGNDERGYERRRIRGKARAGNTGSRPGTSTRAFMSDVDEALARGARRKEVKKWQQAWSRYHADWEALKSSTDALQGAALARALPWPVASGFSQHVNKENVEEFVRNYSLADGETRMGVLKAERFRWHPDKIQHRFGGDNVDEETLRLVTSVFQTIDEMMTIERKKEG